MIAVANVTRNRVKSPHYPNSYCEVIKEGPIRESWKTRKNPDLPDSERIYFPNEIDVNFLGIVMVNLIRFPLLIKIFTSFQWP